MLTFEALRVASVERQKLWDKDGKISASFRGNEMAGETGEACNVIKKLERETLGLPGSRDTPDHLGMELADIVICADLIATGYGLSLGDYVARKFNETSEKVGFPIKL